MNDRFGKVFGSGKPVIAMVHFGALPGAPLYDADQGLDGIVEGARKDLRALQAAGFEAEDFMDRIGRQAVKDKLMANTQAAVERGVFGAPTMFVGGEIFFGQDRLDFVEEALAA